MASSGDVQLALEPSAEAEQQAAEACDADNGSGSSAAATSALTEETGAAEVLVEQQHDVPPPGQAPEDPAGLAEEAKDPAAAKDEATADDQESTRERLRRHRREMAGRVWVPELWGQEELLKDWVDCAVFDRPLVPSGLLTARRALVAECRTRRPDPMTAAASAGSSPLRVQHGCP